MLNYETCKHSLISSITDLNEDPVFVDCGLLPYPEALQLQLRLQKNRIEDTLPNVFLLLEHPPVITMGARRGDNKLVSTVEQMEGEGILLEQIRRGGGATSHNPGQLVVYPIVKLRSLGFRVVTFVHYLEQIGIDLIADYGVTCKRKKGFPGLWVEDSRKIASIGLQINIGVTMHGMAVNLDNDLSVFRHIIPCGLEGVEMTSVHKETGGIASVVMGEAKARAVASCRQYLPENSPLFRYPR